MMRAEAYSGHAIAGLAAALLSLLMLAMPPVSLALAAVAVCSIVAGNRRFHRDPELGGVALAVTGLVVADLSVLIAVWPGLVLLLGGVLAPLA